MIRIFTTKYRPATDTKQAFFIVKCLVTGRSKRVPYNYGAHNAMRDAIQTAYNVPPDWLEFVCGHSGLDTYATQYV